MIKRRDVNLTCSTNRNTVVSMPFSEVKSKNSLLVLVQIYALFDLLKMPLYGHLKALLEAVMEPLLARTSVGISELKLNPSAVLEASSDMPVAILNRNKPVGYLMTAAAWEKIHEILEDREIMKIVESRLKDGKKPVKIKLDDL